MPILMQVFTVEDRTELEVSAPSAMQTIQYYDANKLHFEDLDAKLECLFSKVLWLKSLELYHTVYIGIENYLI